MRNLPARALPVRHRLRLRRMPGGQWQAGLLTLGTILHCCTNNFSKTLFLPLSLLTRAICACPVAPGDGTGAICGSKQSYKGNENLTLDPCFPVLFFQKNKKKRHKDTYRVK